MRTYAVTITDTLQRTVETKANESDSFMDVDFEACASPRSKERER